ncbi:MAG: hypothetical protein RJQ09_04380 [Cyclobacteriaceae bacterium]
MKTRNLLLILLMFAGWNLLGQRIPSEFEHIEYLVTFGPKSHPAWGDDDHVQTFFFIVPETFTEPIYLRVFDPDVGGTLDESNRGFNTKTSFSIYGGEGAHLNPDAQDIDPIGDYKSGQLLATKTFGLDSKFDGKWYNFGPFNPLEGELSHTLNGYVFKVIAEGIEGNDGNLYRYFLSVSPNTNREVEGANAFTYEYSFRLPEDKRIVTHLYPFLDDKVISITQHNFDYDNEGKILLYSVAKNRHIAATSPNIEWASSTHKISEEERNTTIDLQILKSKNSRNDMVLYVKNQYGEAIPFFTVPIGGPPKFKYKVDLNVGE